MKARNPQTGNLETVYVKALDSMPVGTQIEYTGDTIPTGWEEVNDYSTTEIDTGKKWINGSPIYRKVIEITSTNASASNWKEYTFSTLGLPSTLNNVIFIDSYGFLTQANQMYVESLPSNGSRIQVNIDGNKLNVLGNGASYSKYQVIIEYTKSS